MNRETRLYWRHALSRFKLRGRYITWAFADGWWWIRVGQLMIKWRRFA